MGNKEMRITDEELATIKSMFADNLPGLKILRKIFLPEINANAPLGQNLDLWMTMKVEDQDPEAIITNLKARNTLISHVEQCLMQLNVLAGQKTETVDDTKARLAANSTK
jgi:hypothetical protein